MTTFTVRQALIEIDKALWKKFRPHDKIEDSGLNVRNADLWLKEDIYALVLNFCFSQQSVFTELDRLIMQYQNSKEIYDSIDFSYIETQISIRSNWNKALANVKVGSDLSSKIGYGLSKNDLKALAKLHAANKHRKKIEDLLEDCNFHSDCGKFEAGEYDEYLEG